VCTSDKWQDTTVSTLVTISVDEDPDRTKLKIKHTSCTEDSSGRWLKQIAMPAQHWNRFQTWTDLIFLFINYKF